MIIFLAIMITGGSLLLSDQAQKGPLLWFSEVITAAAGLILEATGFAVQHHSQTLAAPSHSFLMFVSNNCNGAWAHLIFLASILAYPATVKQKLLGLGLGQGVLLCLSVLRVATLFLVGAYVPAVFSAVHLYVWQFLLIAFALVLLFIWAEKVAVPAT